MKKILSILFIFIIIISFTGCTKSKTVPKENDNLSNEPTTTKSIVLYFSATNNTKEVAQKIKNITDSDITEIIPKQKYTSEDLNYNNDNCRANKEQNSNTSRPEIANTLKLDNYQTIYLGYPIWWGKEPKIILTLLDNYNLEGKTIIPFCTSGGSSIETSVNNIRNYNPKLNVLEGKKFNPNDSEETIKNWLQTLDK